MLFKILNLPLPSLWVMKKALRLGRATSAFGRDLLVLLHAIHDGSDLSFRGLATHLEEHRADHLLIDRRVLGHLALDESAGAEEAAD